MSKRHQSQRRKSYGRRQHEVRERHERIRLPDGAELTGDDLDMATSDPFAFLDPRTARLHFAAGD